MTLNAEEFAERRIGLAGWPVNVASYRLGDTWHAKADNVSPGANLARTSGQTREQAEQAAIARAAELLARTKRHTV